MSYDDANNVNSVHVIIKYSFHDITPPQLSSSRRINAKVWSFDLDTNQGLVTMIFR